MLKNMSKKRKFFIIEFIILILLVLLPQVVSSNYYLRIVTNVLYFGALGSAWNIIGGYGGQLSMGHSTFFAVGAYSCSLLLVHFSMMPFVGTFLGLIIAVIISYLLGRITFGLRGPYFTLSTLAFCQISRLLLLYFKDLTGGALGVTIPFRKESLMYFQFRSEQPYYYMALLLLLICIFITYKIEKSKMGWYLVAIKNDQDASKALGIDLMKWKLRAFVLSAVLTSIIGSFFSLYIMYIDPDSVCSVDLSTKILLTAVLGGRGTILGPVLGSAILIPLTEACNVWFGSGRAGASLFVYGILLVFIVLISPKGIIDVFKTKFGKKFWAKMSNEERQVQKNA